jgi:hypothetical protein
MSTENNTVNTIVEEVPPAETNATTTNTEPEVSRYIQITGYILK